MSMLQTLGFDRSNLRTYATGLRSEPRSGCQRLQWTTCLLCSSLCRECKETGWTNTAMGTQRRINRIAKKIWRTNNCAMAETSFTRGGYGDYDDLLGKSTLKQIHCKSWRRWNLTGTPVPAGLFGVVHTRDPGGVVTGRHGSTMQRARTCADSTRGHCMLMHLACLETSFLSHRLPHTRITLHPHKTSQDNLRTRRFEVNAQTVRLGSSKCSDVVQWKLKTKLDHLFSSHLTLWPRKQTTNCQSEPAWSSCIAKARTESGVPMSMLQTLGFDRSDLRTYAAGLRSEPRSGCQRLQWTTCLLCSSLRRECKETGWTNTAMGTQREHGPALTLYLGTLHVDVPCLLEDIFLSHDLQSIIH